jgi:hypothetical protein
MEEEFSSKLAIKETQPVEQYPYSKKQQRDEQVSSLTEKTKRGISQASNDVLFQYIEQHQQQHGTFGHLLDAGTGSHSLRWIASLFHKDNKTLITEFTAITADETMQRKVLEEARMVQIEHHGNIQVGNWITDAELCCGKIYDCILADYLIGLVVPTSHCCLCCCS